MRLSQSLVFSESRILYWVWDKVLHWYWYQTKIPTWLTNHTNHYQYSYPNKINTDTTTDTDIWQMKYADTNNTIPISGIGGKLRRLAFSRYQFWDSVQDWNFMSFKFEVRSYTESITETKTKCKIIKFLDTMVKKLKSRYILPCLWPN